MNSSDTILLLILYNMCYIVLYSLYDVMYMIIRLHALHGMFRVLYAIVCIYFIYVFS